MPLGLADQLFQVGFAVAVGAAGGALFWQPRALIGGGDGATVLDGRLGEPWATRLLRGLALLAILLAAVLIYGAVAA